MLETRSEVLKSFDGLETDVLFEETTSDGFYIGHTPNYIEAKLKYKTDEDLSSEIRKCKLIYDPNTTDHMLCEFI